MNNKKLVKAAKALVDKLDSLPNDPRYMAVWISWKNHGFDYDGPFYVDELKALRDALEGKK